MYTVEQINTELARITQAIADMKSAIASKGVTVPANATLADLPNLILQI